MDKYVISEHALFQMQRRGISEPDLRSVIENPERTEEVRLVYEFADQAVESGTI